MPEINLDLSYFEWPETVRLVGLLGRGAEVLPIKLKTYCGKVSAESGRLSGYSAREVESAIGWWGAPEVAAAALAKVGFLKVVDGGYEVMEREGVSWADGQGHIVSYAIKGRLGAKARWDKARREAEAIAASNAPSIATSNAKQVIKQCSDGRTEVVPPYGGTPAASSEVKQLPAPSETDLAFVNEQPLPGIDVVLTFPAVGRGPQTWALTPAKLAEYREAFPGVDALQECKKALQWCRDNPRQRKTAGGMAAFLGRWLAKEQDRAKRNARPASSAAGRGSVYDSTVRR